LEIASAPVIKRKEIDFSAQCMVHLDWWISLSHWILYSDQMCIREDEFHDVLKACHDESYGRHFADHKTWHKVLHMGYYWPSIFKDAKKYLQDCDSCPRMDRSGQADEIPLQPQVVMEPFERWALDFVGPFN
jgi:hypothetical protein